MRRSPRVNQCAYIAVLSIALLVSAVGHPESPGGGAMPPMPTKAQKKALDKCLVAQGVKPPQPGERPDPGDEQFADAMDKCAKQLGLKFPHFHRGEN